MTSIRNTRIAGKRNPNATTANVTKTANVNECQLMSLTNGKR